MLRTKKTELFKAIDRHIDLSQLIGQIYLSPLLLSSLLLFLFLLFSSSTSLSQKKEEIAKTSLKVGDVAPDFALLSDQWKPVKLSDYRGKKNVFLAVYVLAFTGG